MSEDQILVLASKSFATSLCKSAEARGRAGVLNNDMTFDVEEGLGSGGNGVEKKGRVRRLQNHIETWKTHDDINFVKSADLTHFIDFGKESLEETLSLRQNDLLRASPSVGGSAEDTPVSGVIQHVDSAAEEAVAHTLMHGMSKCTTSVAFHEEFEEVTSM